MPELSLDFVREQLSHSRAQYRRTDDQQLALLKKSLEVKVIVGDQYSVPPACQDGRESDEDPKEYPPDKCAD
jgi:hypothetical protein